MEQNNGGENENDEKMKVVEKDERTSDHKDNDMRNVKNGDKQDAKVHEQQEEGHKVHFYTIFIYISLFISNFFFSWYWKFLVVTRLKKKSLMGMEKAFEKVKKFVLQTNVSDMDESWKKSTFSEFEEKYMELKRLFFLWAMLW